MGELMILLAAAQAAAVQASAPPTGASSPDITVTGNNRVVCRRAILTQTRIGSGRVCRTIAQWRREEGGSAAADNPNATIDGAADTLQQVDQKVSTNDIGGELSRVNGRTPLGPR